MMSGGRGRRWRALCAGEGFLVATLVATMGVSVPQLVHAGQAFAAGVVARPVRNGENGPLLVTVTTARSSASTLLALPFQGRPRVILSGLPSHTAIGVSPRGRYVALAEGVPGLWVVASAGTGLRRRLLPPASSAPRTHRLAITGVAWSPDRYTLAYLVTEERIPDGQGGIQGYDQDAQGGLWVARYDGGAPRHIATFAQLSPELDGVSWSSDGQRIAVNTDGAVTVIAAATGRASGAIVQGAGTFSPTDPVLAYTDNGDGNCGPLVSGLTHGGIFCTVDAQGQRRRIVGRDRAGTGSPSADTLAEGPTWSPDGRSLAYLWQTDPPSRRVEIHVLDLARGRVRVLRLAPHWETGLGYALTSLAWLPTPLS